MQFNFYNIHFNIFFLKIFSLNNQIFTYNKINIFNYKTNLHLMININDTYTSIKE